MKRQEYYPFTAIVGQEQMKKALILNIINPTLGGVLIRGEKGTAKSTAVRALAELMPERTQVKGCRYSCDPEGNNLCDECMKLKTKNVEFDVASSNMKVVDLPVSATEDRVVGTLDIEYAIKNGEKKFELGILAQANRNILYVDEINLLDDHVVDVLLDSAAMGINTIEREGISYSHPARFTLVGTMNPEEGDLRPQLLDRFGLVVDVIGENSKEQRALVVKRRLEYEANPQEFASHFKQEQVKLAQQIVNAKQKLEQVTYDDTILELAAQLSITFGVDGHRADIVMIKTAMTIAAFEGRDYVTTDDLKEAAIYVLPHRLRRRPFESRVLDINAIDQILSTMEANS